MEALIVKLGSLFMSTNVVMACLIGSMVVTLGVFVGISIGIGICVKLGD